MPRAKQQINWEAAKAYDAKHPIFEVLVKAFEADGGGSGHDLGLTGALAIVRAWEKIRTPESVKDLEMLGES